MALIGAPRVPQVGAATHVRVIMILEIAFMATMAAAVLVARSGRAAS
jgi:hypothetical protein